MTQAERAISAILRWGSRPEVRRRLWAHGGEHLSPTDAWLLERAAAGDAPRMSDLAAWQQVDRSTITAQVTRLERAGLVERVHDPDDRRVVHVSATEHGRRVQESTALVARDVLTDVLADWDPEDVCRFASSLARFADTLTTPVAQGRPLA